MKRRAVGAIAIAGLLLVGLYTCLPSTRPTYLEDFRSLIASKPRQCTTAANDAIHASYSTSTISTVRANTKDPSPASWDNEDYIVHTDRCRIRNFDFDDSIIMKRYFSAEPPQCPAHAKPLIFYPRLNLKGGFSCIGVDKAEAKKYYYSEHSEWSCTYKEVTRDESQNVIDLHHTFGKEKVFNAGDCPQEEFIWITCKLPRTKYKYQQPLMLPRVKETVIPVRPNNRGKKPLHVLVTGLDSVSRLNAHRQFPKTMEFFRKKKNTVELFGYNKIGLNSAPNQIPLLTGVPYGAGLGDRLGGNYFDNLTRYLWDFYDERGFRTMFYEEQWMWGLFVYPSSRGFKKVPTTYWPRPMMQAIDGSALKVEGGNWCIGRDIAAKYYLDYTHNTFQVLGNDRPLFSYSWLSETAHDDVNGGKRVDKYYFDLFTKMETNGILDNTAVFFISDHGFRWGDFRKTALGALEDMLPYGFILLPDSYYEEMPNALRNLRVNSRRLVTVYDLHATLLELADPWSEGRTVRTANGYSLLSNEITSDRSCVDAGIPFQFCACFELQLCTAENNFSSSLADFVIATLNENIRVNNATAKCHEWTLDVVESSYRISEGDKWTDFYKAVIRTIPPAQFEVAAHLSESNQRWKLLSDLDRIDRFDINAKCVAKESYERYCYCR